MKEKATCKSCIIIKLLNLLVVCVSLFPSDEILKSCNSVLHYFNSFSVPWASIFNDRVFTAPRAKHSTGMILILRPELENNLLNLRRKLLRKFSEKVVDVSISGLISSKTARGWITIFQRLPKQVRLIVAIIIIIISFFDHLQNTGLAFFQWSSNSRY
jgi:hypothetical protein